LAISRPMFGAAAATPWGVGLIGVVTRPPSPAR
jgi:hypothetical protein